MYIQSTNNNVNMYGGPKKPGILNRIQKKILDSVSERTFNSNEEKIKKWAKYSDKMTRPAENRGIMGFTAIFLQPSIDYNNKKVDEKTRLVSVCRTVAKIVVGTLVGIMIRGGVYKAVEKMTQINGTKKWHKALLPSSLNHVKDKAKLLNYRSALSTLSALGIMLFTNFAIDAPWTLKLTNILKEKFVDENEKISLEKEREVIYG